MFFFSSLRLFEIITWKVTIKVSELNYVCKNNFICASQFHGFHPMEAYKDEQLKLVRNLYPACWPWCTTIRYNTPLLPCSIVSLCNTTHVSDSAGHFDNHHLQMCINVKQTEHLSVAKGILINHSNQLHVHRTKQIN